MSTQSFGQGMSATSGGPKTQISKIFLFGLGGAVLGLSTLSFHGKPHAHLENIAYGFGLGILIGAVYVTYDTTTDPQKLYSDYELPTQRKLADIRSTPTLMGYSWEF